MTRQEIENRLLGNILAVTEGMTVGKRKAARIVGGEKKLERYKKEWIPLESRYFDTYKIKEQCDVVMDTTNLF